MPSEEEILRAIWDLRPGATILMVAHRLESLRFCDDLLEFPGPVFRSSAGLDEQSFRGVSCSGQKV